MRTRLRYPYSFQIVTLSPWPITTSLSVTNLLISFVMSIQKITNSLEICLFSLTTILISIYFWLSDITYEGTYRGEHTKQVQKNIKDSFLLFLLSEILIFLSLFYIYFYNSIIPNIWIGSIYPPLGIESISFEGIPLLNTALLFFGSLTMTGGHYSTIAKSKKLTNLLLLLTILLNTIFTMFQVFEYYQSSFNISDSVYSSAFYITTGLHGIHVVIGTIMAIIIFFRLLLKDFTDSNHLGLWASVLYIHLVDFVWLVVLVIFYIWGA